MAIACFRDVTFFPLPDFNFPSFISCIVFSTFSDAFSEYFAIIVLHFELLLNTSAKRTAVSVESFENSLRAK
jgi:hypothetical protein